MGAFAVRSPSGVPGMAAQLPSGAGPIRGQLREPTRTHRGAESGLPAVEEARSAAAGPFRVRSRRRAFAGGGVCIRGALRFRRAQPVVRVAIGRFERDARCQ